MSEMLIEILKVIMMLSVLLITRYLVPWIKAKIGAERMEEVKSWVNAAVLMAQQVYDTKLPAERKAIVVDFLHCMLTKKNIDISEKQLDTLIEAAVRAMKMQQEG